MLPDRVSNPGPLTYESGALPFALSSPALKGSVRNLRFLWVAVTCYLVFTLVAKLTYLVAIKGGHVAAWP